MHIPTGQVVHSAILPSSGQDNVLGDLVTSDNLIYTTDSIGGAVYRYSVADGLVEKVANATASSDYGIDGLYRHGNTLVAIQNGIRPHRVSAPDFDEPTLGAVVGDRLFFVANSQWNRFDRDNELPDQLAGPIILSVAIEE